ncbi:MAG: YlxR family protein [Chloroflexi bacterium]|nr:MAG: YlxR family protein [Chloroflexota bacterium]
MTLPRRRGREIALPRTEPLRTCVGCRQVKARSELHRLALVEGVVVVDPRRLAGRSAYLCRDRGCWEMAEKRRALDRALEQHLTAHDWERLRQGILI